MSIEKLDFKKVTKENIPYALINTKVIQQIKDPLAGYIWVYLCSLPPDWRVCKEQLMKHFDIGKVRMKKIFSFLKKSNLIEYIQEKNEKGVYLESAINVLCGDRFIDIDLSGGTKSIPPVQPVVQKTDLPVTRSNGKQPTTKENKITKALKSTKPIKSSYENEKKHSWANSKDQMACETKAINEHEKRKALEIGDNKRSMALKEIKDVLGIKK